MTLVFTAVTQRLLNRWMLMNWGGFFSERITCDANIKTVNQTGYKPLKKDYMNLEQKPSKNGGNFPLMHRQIMMFKSWLREIHHHCKHLQRYLDQFCYRFNRLKYTQTLFHKLIERMVFCPPLIHQYSRECVSALFYNSIKNLYLAIFLIR